MARLERRIGVHTSIAGALDRSADEAIELGCNCFQIFTRGPRIWRAAPLDPADTERLNALRREHDLRPLVVHGSYLINLATADPVNRARSNEGFREELERAKRAGADYLVIHSGSAKGSPDRPSAIAALAAAFEEAVEGFKWGGLELLLENTAGGGASLGADLAELAAIRRALRSVRTGPPN